MKKVVIIGAGISGMTAGIYLQKAGFETEIYEKNAVPGGQCTGWKREGYMIDNCIHWLTGTKEGSGLNALWKEVGALGDGVEVYEKEKFFSAELDGETLTLWRDKDRTRKELLALSPEDEAEINQLMDMVASAESMQVPVEKPFDKMSISDYIKMGMSMAEMGKVMKLYGGMDIKELAERFKHPLIKRAIVDYMPPGYQAYAFVVSYATVTAGNGDIPQKGSLAMALRMAKRYQDLGGKLYLNAPVEKVIINGKKAEGIVLASKGEIEEDLQKRTVKADYVICASDANHTFTKLLDKKYMPKDLCKLFKERKAYPVMTAFQVAFAVEGKLDELKETNIFSCKPLTVGTVEADRMSVCNYSYEPSFAPEGNTILQTMFTQNEDDYEYWMELVKDKEAYQQKKEELSKEIESRLVERFPQIAGKVRILDVWTPVTYHRYCNSFHGAYMGFIVTKNAKNKTVAGKIKGLSNVFIASQWLMGPGGLPTAASMGKFAAQRIVDAKR
ncbi:MAG: NAD(P)/FAD-dependent oxidoreductase [Lachnospiraceae bacterium]|nr:NAD(P)/FAD-dependent oxidoreductase [Lachnospiraceae bacterium]